MLEIKMDRMESRDMAGKEMKEASGVLVMLYVLTCVTVK